MAWIQSHQSLGTHRKTKALRRLLKIKNPTAIGHLHLLWWWCLDNTPDGDLSGIDDADLAEAAEWQGDPKKFVDSLVEAGFIDENSRKLHDWGDYSGKMLERRIRNKERQNEFRMKHRNSYVTVTSPLRNGARVDKNRVYNTSSNIYIDAARERENNDQEKSY